MTGYLYNTSRYSVFKRGSLKIKFKTSPFLEKYISVKKWDNGYIECMVKYSTLEEPVEDYIDLRYVANQLELPDDIFKDINEVVVGEP